MDNKKFEQLIDLIINENEDQARALFHDIVVEKSREIYESMMYADEGMNPEGGQIGDLLDEIDVEETQGVTEEDNEFDDIEMAGDEEDMSDDMGDEDMGDEEEELEDRVVDLEDKLDQLMAEFEELMGSEEEEMGDEEDMGDEDMGDEDMGDEDMMEAHDDEDQLDESVQLQKVAPAKMGDDGANSKSVALSKPKLVQTGAKSVNFSQGDEKGRAAPTTQTVKGDFKNAVGIKGAKTETAPKPHTAQATGVNTKSPMAESKKSTKVSK